MLATGAFAVPILRTLPFFCTTRIWAHVKLDCTCSGSQVHYRVSQIQMKQQIKKASVAPISLTIASPYVPNMLEPDLKTQNPLSHTNSLQRSLLIKKNDATTKFQGSCVQA